jgi:hypothetical protein
METPPSYSAPAGRRPPPALPIGERRVLLSQAVEMVANGRCPSLIVVGQPGMGKTHEVTRTLHAMGLALDHDYFHLKGYTSPRGLFETLYENNGYLTLFDDCDSALNDPVAVQLLRAALDSHRIRTISWLSAAKTRGNLPKTFQFDGQVIFISNRLVSDIDDAVHSRSLTIDYHMNRREILQHMEAILPAIECDASPEQRRSGLEFIRHWAPHIKQLDLRRLVSVLRIITAQPNNWERLAIHTITQ